jgi:hypothetical protein
VVTEGEKYLLIRIRTGVRSLIKEGSSNADGFGEIERPQKGHTCQPTRSQKADIHWPKQTGGLPKRNEKQNKCHKGWPQ